MIERKNVAYCFLVPWGNMTLITCGATRSSRYHSVDLKVDGLVRVEIVYTVCHSSSLRFGFISVQEDSKVSVIGN